MVAGETVMDQRRRTIPEIRAAGFEALLQHLGPADTLRFLHQYDPGRGDYTKERHQWLDQLSVDEIMDGIRNRRHATDPDSTA